MERRRLKAVVALSREASEKQAEENRKRKELGKMVNDKRNLHLARVGLIRGII